MNLSPHRQQYRRDVGRAGAATLITVGMVGLYRTPQAIEAAWKYFILASVASPWPFSAPS